MPVRYEVKKLNIEIDDKKFEPCIPKEVEVWRWRKMRNEKLVVHIDKELNVTIRRIDP